MSAFFNRTDPIIPPLSEREEERFLRLQDWAWGKRFAARLKDNALRMKRFLHAGN
jgi:hypothetical protein